MWENEKLFGKAVMSRLKKEGFSCTRIETAATVNGMPDLFVQGRGIDAFIELKNDKTLHSSTGTFKVKWRPGQLAWAAEYRQKHLKTFGDFVLAKVSWTFVGGKDGNIIAIPMCSKYTCSTVNCYDIKYTIDKDDSLYDLLSAHSQVVMPLRRPEQWSAYDFVEGVAGIYRSAIAGPAEADIDWPDTDIILSEVMPDKIEAPASFDDCMKLSVNTAEVLWSCFRCHSCVMGRL